MPYTLSHTVFAVPIKRLNRKLFCSTGLALGSMSPDFEYFFHLQSYRTIGHTVEGLFFQAIPACILLALVYHHLLKEAVAVHLPSYRHLDQRAVRLLGRWRLRTVREWATFLFSVIVGFITHIVLDACTHRTGYVVMRLPFLREVSLFGLPVYQILQYGLSVSGLLIIALVAWSRLRRAQVEANPDFPSVDDKQKFMFWLVACSISLLTTVLKLTWSPRSSTISILAVAPVTGMLLGLFVSSLLFRHLKPRLARLSR